MALTIQPEWNPTRILVLSVQSRWAKLRDRVTDMGSQEAFRILLGAEKFNCLTVNLPSDRIAPICDYVVLGLEPGPFLEAVFTNNFHNVMVLASNTDMPTLRNYEIVLKEAIPIKAWRNRENFETWKMKSGLIGPL